MVGAFPLVTFDHVANSVADALLAAWGHWLGPCTRPFGIQSFVLEVAGTAPVAVAVSASTVNQTCAGLPRNRIVELARCASHPDHRWATRVCLRLWREIAPRCWSERYWPVEACVSYQNAVRHTGNLYRFDGWERAREVPGGVAGGNWTRGKRYDPKVVWVWRVPGKAAA